MDVNNEMASHMSLFYAHATPMMKMLSDATTRFVSEVSTYNYALHIDQTLSTLYMYRLYKFEILAVVLYLWCCLIYY